MVRKLRASAASRAALFYCAFIQLSEPVNLTATSDKKTRTGWPSAVPR
jgi:hypothetical protein